MASEFTKEELISAASRIVPGDVTELSLDELFRLITVAQFLSDQCLNEIELRGELRCDEEAVHVPYQSLHHLETILTRSGLIELRL
jgi:hypothetical protein